MNSKEIIINVNTKLEIRELTILIMKQFKLDKYENQTCKPIMITARNLHSSINCNEIVKKLKEKNFKTEEVDHVHLPLYVLSIVIGVLISSDLSEDIRELISSNKSDDINEIYNISTLII